MHFDPARQAASVKIIVLLANALFNIKHAKVFIEMSINIHVNYSCIVWYRVTKKKSWEINHPIAFGGVRTLTLQG